MGKKSHTPWDFCHFGNVDEVRAALEKGKDVNCQNEKNQTALIQAARRDYVSIMRLLLEQPLIEVNMTDKSGFTALYWAVYCDKIEAVRLLLADQRVDVNIKDADNQTALIYAAGRCSENRDSILKLLLEHPSINVNLADDRGFTALHVAIDSKDIETVKTFLADERVDVNYASSAGFSPLWASSAGRTPLWAAGQTNNIDIFKLLLSDQRVDVNWKTESGCAVLHSLVWNKDNIKLFELLLAHEGVDVNCKHEQLSETVLHQASSGIYYNVEVVRLILAEPRFTSANELDSEGNTALRNAAVEGLWDVFRELTHHPSIDLGVRDQDGWSVDDLAR